MILSDQGRELGKGIQPFYAVARDYRPGRGEHLPATSEALESLIGKGKRLEGHLLGRTIRSFNRTPAYAIGRDKVPSSRDQGNHTN
jgi:hypothetical protein